MKVQILAFGAHPDDVELSCSGTLLRHKAMGYSIGIVDLTEGEMGTRGNPSLRKEEANTAAQILGLSARWNLGLADAFFQNDRESQLKVIEAIRFFQPDVVLTNAPSDRHPDHGRGATLVTDACFYSGLSKIVTEYEGLTQLPWRPKQLFHYIQDRHIKPDFVVDISEYQERKMASIKAFASQFYDPSSKEPETPISTKDFLIHKLSRDRDNGRIIQVEAAEGFLFSRQPGVNNFFDLY